MRRFMPSADQRTLIMAGYLASRSVRRFRAQSRTVGPSSSFAEPRRGRHRRLTSLISARALAGLERAERRVAEGSLTLPVPCKHASAVCYSGRETAVTKLAPDFDPPLTIDFALAIE
jgi:hypothetical protein